MKKLAYQILSFSFLFGGSLALFAQVEIFTILEQMPVFGVCEKQQCDEKFLS
jgi:hypothetical protein